MSLNIRESIKTLKEKAKNKSAFLLFYGYCDKIIGDSYFNPFFSMEISFIFAGLCLFLVCAFEFINGFHDTANAVAPVIYSNSL